MKILENKNYIEAEVVLFDDDGIIIKKQDSTTIKGSQPLRVLFDLKEKLLENGFMPIYDEQMYDHLPDRGLKEKCHHFINPKYIPFLVYWPDKFNNLLDIHCNDGAFDSVLMGLDSSINLSLRYGVILLIENINSSIDEYKMILHDYKNYILKFKEKFPEKLLLHELGWNNEIEVFDYNIFF